MSAQQSIPIDAQDVIMTVGAGGALNVTLHALLDPGDQVVVLAPYFPGYLEYIRAHGGSVGDCGDPPRLSSGSGGGAEGPHFAHQSHHHQYANNPTGRIYSDAEMRGLSDLLVDHQRRWNRSVYLLADTVYSGITYQREAEPRLLQHHRNTLLHHSHSKDLGLAGERIGYLVISPYAAHRQELRAACVLGNRALGFGNAPALMQLCIERVLGQRVEIAGYAQARNLLLAGLTDAGYDVIAPDGAFYAFPACPGAIDDLTFTDVLRGLNVLVVPGRGFGRANHVRIAFCVAPQLVERALPRFAEARIRVTTR